MAATKWLGLWHQEGQGFYAGQVINKGDIPQYTRLVMRFNKFYEAGSNRPRFVYCFADSTGYEDKCVPVEWEEEGERLYTKDEVYRIIHGMERLHGLSYDEDLIEDYI